MKAGHAVGIVVHRVACTLSFRRIRSRYKSQSNLTRESRQNAETFESDPFVKIVLYRMSTTNTYDGFQNVVCDSDIFIKTIIIFIITDCTPYNKIKKNIFSCF